MHRYKGSDGQQYADSAIWEKLETEEWKICCWDVDTRLQVVETEAQELLFLRPADDASPIIGGTSEERA